MPNPRLDYGERRKEAMPMSGCGYSTQSQSGNWRNTSRWKSKYQNPTQE